jgi:hypothetical protein
VIAAVAVIIVVVGTTLLLAERTGRESERSQWAEALPLKWCCLRLCFVAINVSIQSPSVIAGQGTH